MPSGVGVKARENMMGVYMYIGSGAYRDRQTDRPPEELSNRFKLTSQAFFPFVCRLPSGEAIPAVLRVLACMR